VVDLANIGSQTRTCRAKPSATGKFYHVLSREYGGDSDIDKIFSNQQLMRDALSLTMANAMDSMEEYGETGNTVTHRVSR